MRLIFKLILLPFTILMWLFGTSHAANYNENYFNKLIAKELNGKVEVRTRLNRRVDILTKDTAWECDWSYKAWSEGVGQALTYAELTGKKPGICVLIDSKKENADHIALVKIIAKKHKIKLVFYLCNKSNGKMKKVTR